MRKVQEFGLLLEEMQNSANTCTKLLGGRNEADDEIAIRNEIVKMPGLNQHFLVFHQSDGQLLV